MENGKALFLIRPIAILGAVGFKNMSYVNGANLLRRFEIPG